MTLLLVVLSDLLKFGKPKSVMDRVAKASQNVGQDLMMYWVNCDSIFLFTQHLSYINLVSVISILTCWIKKEI